ncbi:MAG: hypothetical protein HKN94_10890 [Acidimicrobiales bacterium]|nr:hypothetical protein [Acidimicrobiales bacterium]RZV47726.1 MAG: hypothetical protein EX269_04210 [Acidimicrobiales bacterium]
MTFTQIHPGGYLWRVERSERDACILQLATDIKKLIVVTRSDVAAQELSERLTLSGMPSVAAVSDDSAFAFHAYASDDLTTLVVSDAALHANAPLASAMVIHAQLAHSPKTYHRRVADASAPVHVSLVVPEDVDIVDLLLPGITEGEVHDLEESVAVDSVVDLTVSANGLATAGRRRFPLSR